MSSVAIATDGYTPTRWQSEVLRTPRECDLALLGGKGSGKTAIVPFLLMRDEQEFGSDLRSLYVRKSHGGTQEFTLMLYEALARAYGARAVSFNSQSGLFKFGRATCVVDQLAEPKDLQKHWGKSYSLILCDEIGEYNGLDLIEKLRASLRPPVGVPARMILIGNPGGSNHAVLMRKFVAGTTPWTPRIDVKTGRRFLYCPSTYRDNPHIDRDDYVAQLRAACADDPQMLKAWLDGSFAAMKGGYFSSVVDEARNMVEPWPKMPPAKYWGAGEWRPFLAMDWGSAAPACVYLVAESPGAEAFGKFYQRGSLILVAELSTNTPDSLTEGLGWTTTILAEAIVDLCKHWKVRPQGCADDACFSKTGAAAGSIADEFRAKGVYLYPAKKRDRISGWQRMRTLLANAGQADVPGLYISRACSYWFSTVPFLPRDPRRPEDVASNGPDHAADATRYACLHQRQQMQKIKLSGF
ncbi:MAG: phage terminase large subunit [Casimicrobiaceae bacterium]